MSLPPNVVRCPRCRGAAHLRRETLAQYKRVVYGCRRCEACFEPDDVRYTSAPVGDSVNAWWQNRRQT